VAAAVPGGCIAAVAYNASGRDAGRHLLYWTIQIDEDYDNAYDDDYCLCLFLPAAINRVDNMTKAGRYFVAHLIPTRGTPQAAALQRTACVM